MAQLGLVAPQPARHAGVGAFLRSSPERGEGSPRTRRSRLLVLAYREGAGEAIEAFATTRGCRTKGRGESHWYARSGEP